MDKCTSITKT